ncbi:hypothetical protein [Pelomonas sp. SE-A7]|uniref:hypothetical protein n=1 Tax=Pelomonas sp. SE-A7 TaxID=3054953 RepID=UPI00259CCC5A|nr:hypothetical protein [Pelomonas sp. SE-A7]MDM4766250.1 hypothetical protein [Pelomonas sp. SE-A7]
MNAPLIQELEQLSAAERRLLGEALIQSANSESDAPLLSPQQWEELRERLSWHRAHPGEPGLSFEQLKSRLQSLSR